MRLYQVNNGYGKFVRVWYCYCLLVCLLLSIFVSSCMNYNLIRSPTRIIPLCYTFFCVVAFSMSQDINSHIYNACNNIKVLSDTCHWQPVEGLKNLSKCNCKKLLICQEAKLYSHVYSNVSA